MRHTAIVVVLILAAGAVGAFASAGSEALPQSVELWIVLDTGKSSRGVSRELGVLAEAAARGLSPGDRLRVLTAHDDRPRLCLLETIGEGDDLAPEIRRVLAEAGSRSFRNADLAAALQVVRSALERKAAAAAHVAVLALTGGDVCKEQAGKLIPLVGDLEGRGVRVLLTGGVDTHRLFLVAAAEGRLRWAPLTSCDPAAWIQEIKQGGLKKVSAAGSPTPVGLEESPSRGHNRLPTKPVPQATAVPVEPVGLEPDSLSTHGTGSEAGATKGAALVDSRAGTPAPATRANKASSCAAGANDRSDEVQCPAEAPGSCASAQAAPTAAPERAVNLDEAAARVTAAPTGRPAATPLGEDRPVTRVTPAAQAPTLAAKAVANPTRAATPSAQGGTMPATASSSEGAGRVATELPTRAADSPKQGSSNTASVSSRPALAGTSLWGRIRGSKLFWIGVGVMVLAGLGSLLLVPDAFRVMRERAKSRLTAKGGAASFELVARSNGVEQVLGPLGSLRTLHVGSGPENTLRLSGERVEKRHLEIRLGRRPSIRNLAKTPVEANGALLPGRRKRKLTFPAVVKVGDRLVQLFLRSRAGALEENSSADSRRASNE